MAIERTLSIIKPDAVAEAEPARNVKQVAQFGPDNGQRDHDGHRQQQGNPVVGQQQDRQDQDQKIENLHRWPTSYVRGEVRVKAGLRPIAQSRLST